MLLVKTAAASPFLFDFHFDPAYYDYVHYPATDIVFESDKIEPDLYPPLPLYYVSGDVNGYTTPVLGYSVVGYFPVHYTGYFATGGGEYNGIGSVVGISFLALTPSGPGVYGTLNADLAGRGVLAGFGNEIYYVYGTGYLTVTDAAATPEPSSMILLGSGLFALAGFLRPRFARE